MGPPLIYFLLVSYLPCAPLCPLSATATPFFPPAKPSPSVPLPLYFSLAPSLSPCRSMDLNVTDASGRHEPLPSAGSSQRRAAPQRSQRRGRKLQLEKREKQSETCMQPEKLSSCLVGLGKREDHFESRRAGGRAEERAGSTAL